MNKSVFRNCRRFLNRTQKEMAAILGMSLKAVHSYEQGWRSIPNQVERQMLFLVSRKLNGDFEDRPCWEIKDCPPETREACPAWQFDSGDLCWFICGTYCEGQIQKDWNQKMRICRSCQIVKNILDSLDRQIKEPARDHRNPM